MIKTALTALALTFAAASLTPAAAQDRVRVGVLECSAAGGSNFVFKSTKNLKCVFSPAGGGTKTSYTGVINRYGIDLGKTQDTQIVWGVLAAADKFDPHALAGKYVGATAEATAGVGLGANALVGGSNKSIALNPLSLQAQTGINVAAGVAELTLAAAK
ncbi:DUF992 domain-containing protein [Amorphus sp. 3PC139-8]|uniref:DUF992 domain-containing protein n=1 Tax=Amorphus sp. 3PC139-8 TaxID=2735676 RepID=UPI00345CADFC